MPTGYTEELYKKEIPFEQFVMTCARACGPCISMRDMSLSAKIPAKFEPDVYHKNESEKAKETIERLSAMTTEECEAAAEKEYKASKAMHEKAKIEREELRDRLMAMRTKVADWKPPSKHHEELKKFMISQLDDAIKHDASPWTHEAVKRTAAAWRSENLADARSEQKYHANEYKKEVDGVAFANRWLAELRESLEIRKSRSSKEEREEGSDGRNNIAGGCDYA